MSYQAPWWLANPHAQSILPTRLRRIRAAGRWRAISTRDDDTIWVKQLEQGGPLVLLLHGLGGCAESLYVQGMQHSLNQAGFSTWAWNARGAVQPNNTQATYHGGRYTDVQDLIRAAGTRELYAVGFSLGAAMLINTLGRDALGLRGAVTISCPFNFAANAAYLDSPKTWLYRRYLLNRLCKMAARKREHGQRLQAPWSTSYPADAVLAKLKTFRDFDNALTAPLNGFLDADDLYQRVDPGQVLGQVQTPLLMLQASDDPLFTADSRPPLPLPKSCQFELTQGGGHVGFVTGSWPWKAQYYAEQRCREFLLQLSGDIQ